MAVILFIEAAIALTAAFVSPGMTGWVSLAAILAGIILTAVNRNRSPGGVIDFAHLTERVMLYVVFTFGEMIIVISAYFVGDGGFDWNVIYFSLMCFLIVAGLSTYSSYSRSAASRYCWNSCVKKRWRCCLRSY